ncbi:MAG TPA: D-alanyl-D-alanine carboxypeptidase/D-alanyl-D-alanine-endopeptidase [Gemmatimonadaceae bacterium]|nr:D-alanyl-D-alanine carboxypeptidase/D-alanyl-D-alanine-endopeptidase [Gemmatimonadaceae bacterium]
MRDVRTLFLLALATGCAGAPAAAPPPRPALALLPADERQELRAAIDSAVSLPEFANAHWGILIVDPASGDTLYSRNAGKLFMPASNMKIVTGATSLALLGADYRFRTRFATRGTVRDSVLRGDLVVIGTGDPTVSDAMAKDSTIRDRDAMTLLRALADSLRAHGIRRVEGSVIAEGDAFPDSPLGFGWAWDDLDYAYSAGVDELLFNEGFSDVIVRAGRRVGDTVTAETRPARKSPRLRIAATTTARRVPGDTARTTLIDVLHDSISGGVLVEGTIALGDSTVESVAHRAPNDAYLAALREALEAGGVSVAAPTRATPRSRVAPRSTVRDSLARSRPPDTLFTLLSPPLREILPKFEKPSQNQIGEVLLKTLGREKTGVGSADSGRAVVERQLAAWGAREGGYAVRDGSGLSRHDYLTPETIVRVLNAIRADTAFQAFYDALPIAGVDGTIERRMRGTPAQGNVHAKTGYVDKARSLSGYVTTADGRLLVFSVLANNWTVPVRRIESVQDMIATRLAAMHLGTATSRAAAAGTAPR